MSSEPLRVLLVEDNPGDARLLREFLRESFERPVEVEWVDRLAAARAHLEASCPDVVLLDLSLPDAHGLDTVRRAIDAAPDAPIVVLTGLDDQAVALQAVQSGAQDYLVKGQTDPPLLARAIRYAVERKQRDRERRRLLEQEREARSRAEAAVRARDQVLQVFSHDLGNQLSAIQIYAAMLQRACKGPDLPEGPGQWAEGIRQLAEELQGLRQDILDEAQIETGRLSLTPRPLDVAEMLEALCENLAPLAEEKGIHLDVECADPLLPLEADRQRMLQALGNVVGNALKFTPNGGRVLVHAEPDGEEHLRITVTDTGPGIPPEHLPHIFESFWKTRMGNFRGAGLGLSIARGIVEMHGGRLTVESEPGRGSAFALVLPFKSDPQAG